MVCLFCSSQTRVTNSRHNKRTNQVWRRRTCVNCKAVFTSRETVDLAATVVFSNDTTHLEPFRREKLFLSVYDCCKHLKSPEQSAEALTDTIISKLTLRTAGNLTRQQVIQQTTVVLKQFDKVAALQYQALHPIDR